MSRHEESAIPLHRPEHDFQAPRVGTLCRLDAEGRPWVTFEGAHGTEVLARSTLDAPARAGQTPDALEGLPVLLAFEQGDPKRPIIIGFVRETLQPEAVRPELTLKTDPSQRDVVIDGQRLVFDAKQEVLLRCGKSTLLLRKDGRVLLRGTHLVSRASGTNRIRGGSIDLN